MVGIGKKKTLILLWGIWRMVPVAHRETDPAGRPGEVFMDGGALSGVACDGWRMEAAVGWYHRGGPPSSGPCTGPAEQDEAATRRRRTGPLTATMIIYGALTVDLRGVLWTIASGARCGRGLFVLSGFCPRPETGTCRTPKRQTSTRVRAGRMSPAECRWRPVIVWQHGLRALAETISAGGIWGTAGAARRSSGADAEGARIDEIHRDPSGSPTRGLADHRYRSAVDRVTAAS